MFLAAGTIVTLTEQKQTTDILDRFQCPVAKGKYYINSYTDPRCNRQLTCGRFQGLLKILVKILR